jgi:predicted O-methyltransferase YrrM
MQAVAAKLPRLFTERHAWMLYGLVRWLRPETVVEVGSYHGFTALHLLQALEDNDRGQLFCIDDYSLADSTATIHNAAQECGLGHRLRLVSGNSREVEWPRRIDLAYIDGDHSLDGCLADCNKAIERGATCIAIHDTVSWWGPRDYVEMMREAGAGSWDVIEATHDEGLAVLMKRPTDKPAPTYSQEEFPSGLPVRHAQDACAKKSD